MKLEIHIPELAELNTNVRQLIDTLNDLAVVGINAVKREDKSAAAPTRTANAPGACVSYGPGLGVAIGTGPSQEGGSLGINEAEKPKRTRKAKVEEPAPEPGVAETEPQAEPEASPTVAEPEPDQPAAAVEPEPQPEPEPEAPTYVLADCTALSPKLQTAGKLDEAKAWLKKHGADRLKDLDPSHYGAFITFAEGLLG